LGSLFGSFSARGARSKGDQQPDGRVAHKSEALNITGVDTGFLATRALRARKTRKMTVVPSGVSASQETETHHTLTADRTNLSGSLGVSAKTKDAYNSDLDKSTTV
jgi:hypothetical protein